MNILFTGHRGFLGRELIPKLESHFIVHKFPGNLLNFDLLQKFVIDHKIDKIIHAAARGGRRVREDSPHTLAENFAVSINIRNLGIPTLYFCSGAIYGRQLPIVEIHEGRTSDRYPSDYYGQSKYLLREIAIKDQQSIFIRFFNVFGQSEGIDRFISYNIQQYKKEQAMRVFQDFVMDFYYVKDALPIVIQWLENKELPKEVNMVYKDKISLIQICESINSLDRHSVPIDLQSNEKGKDYCGNGSILANLNLPTLGLVTGLTDMYKNSI